VTARARSALVLAAGRGDRLWPLTAVRAKPAVPLAGEPLIRRILRRLASAGIEDVVVNLHHLPATIAGAVGDGSDLGVRVRYSWEQPLLGSAGGPRRAAPLFDEPRFFIVNGDTLEDVDLDVLSAAHSESGAEVTMALVSPPPGRSVGGVRLDDDGFVRGFTPRGRDPRTWHFVGVQLAEASAFARLDEGIPAESVSALYPALMAGNARAIFGFRSTAAEREVGTPRDYLVHCLALAAREGRPESLTGAGSRIDPSARLVDSVIWDRVEIGADSALERTIVTDGVVVPAGARHRDAILTARVPGVTPGPGYGVTAVETADSGRTSADGC